MACPKSNYCSMCAIPTLRRLAILSEGCVKEQVDWQYAAINSYEPPTGLPALSSDKVFSSVPRKHISCVNHLSPLSSLISILYSLSSVPDVIHFGKPDNVAYADLIKVTDSMRRVREGCTLAIQMQDEKPLRLHTYEGETVLDFKQSTIHGLSVLICNSHTLCFHWTSDLAWTNNVFHPGEKSLWICYNSCSTTKRLRLSGRFHSVTAIPLHSDPKSGDMITFNIGSPVLDTRSSASGSYADSVRETATESLECVMKDGKCYSCSRISDIHSAVCGRARQHMAQQEQVALRPQFSECLTLL